MFATMNSESCVPLAFDKPLLDLGVRRFVDWFPDRHPMLLTVGATGQGKSYLLALLMAKLTTHVADSQLYLCDFKNIDFRRFANCPRRWSFDECEAGLAEFHASFRARLTGDDTTTNRKFLVFDEWAGFVLSRDKKSAEEIKNRLSAILMLGRGVSHHVVIGLQRADAQLFPLGGRDQFGAIMAFGNLSREQKLMIAPDFRDEMNATNGRGQAYLLLDGEPVRRVQVPTVGKWDKLNAAIAEGLTR